MSKQKVQTTSNMKRKNKLIQAAIAALILTSALWFVACQKEKNPATPGANGTSEMSAGKSSNSLVFPVQAKMYGKSYADWSAAWWKWDLQFDCDHFPSRDTDGTRENQ